MMYILVCEQEHCNLLQGFFFFFFWSWVSIGSKLGIIVTLASLRIRLIFRMINLPRGLWYSCYISWGVFYLNWRIFHLNWSVCSVFEIKNISSVQSLQIGDTLIFLYRNWDFCHYFFIILSFTKDSKIIYISIIPHEVYTRVHTEKRKTYLLANIWQFSKIIHVFL